MHTRVCCGRIGPDYIHEDTYVTTPDTEIMRIANANANDPPGPIKVLGPSSGGLFSGHPLGHLEYDATQHQRWIPSSGGLFAGNPLAHLGHNATQDQSWIPPPAPPNNDREPISGALWDDERVYTRDDGGGEWKFWGIMEPGMILEDFWAKHDPDNTRGKDESQDEEAGSTPGSFTESQPASLPCKEVVKKPQRKRQNPQTKVSNKVSKSKTSTPCVNKRTHRSLGSEKDKGIEEYVEQARSDEAHVSFSDGEEQERTIAHTYQMQKKPVGRRAVPDSKTANPTSAKARRGRPRATAPLPPTDQAMDLIEDVENVHSTPAKRPRGRPRASAPLDQAMDLNEDVGSIQPTPPKRPRGRPPKQHTPKMIKETGKERKSPAAKGNARVTKLKKSQKPPAAPSTHNMRTRARGPVKMLLLP